jgi:serine phosphatase RsbU (regulator of sigma subunit)
VPFPRHIHRLPILVLVLGCLLSSLLALAASAANSNSQHRLLKLQVRQAASALSAELTGLQTPLTAAFEVTVVTHDPSEFTQLIGSDVGRAGPFVSASLWQVSGGKAKVLAQVGTTSELVTDHLATAFFNSMRPSPTLRVTGLLKGPSPRIGFAEMPPQSGTTEVVYAESALPRDKKAVVPKDSAFSDLAFALFLGRQTSPGTLIETTGSLRGFHTTTSVPFGDSALTLEGTATVPLSGGLSESLPLIVLLVGVTLSIAAALTAEHLIRRRALAEMLARQNARLYLEQRTISETLQHSLLPDEIPELPGIEIGVHYSPGVGGIEVGGDWYDVIPTGSAEFMFVVGDVAGRGLKAATTMAFLRHAMRAYVAEGGGPAVVLTKLGHLVGRASDGQFATVLCGHIEVEHRMMTVACAGHFPPLVIDQTGACYVDVAVAPPIGVLPRLEPVESTVTVGPTATVLAFTDGLVERRGENLDLGLDRLRQAAGVGAEHIDDVLRTLVDELTPDGSVDDIAILGVKWRQ